MTEEVRPPYETYYVVAQVAFLVQRPEAQDLDKFNEELWSKEMASNTIGENLFVRFPREAFNFQITLKTQVVEDISSPPAIDVEAKVVEA